ncbi:hypothetical protein PO909_012141 [Leuciscus waleckii]
MFFSLSLLIPFSAQDVIVGGKGGYEFSFKSFNSKILQISITYFEVCEDCNLSSGTLSTIQVILNNGQMVTVGSLKGSKEQKLVLDENDQIVAATLWPNTDHSRCGGLEFVVAKINGEKESLSVKCDQLGEPVSVDVKSGRCYGIMGRSAHDIDALGFYFI